MEYTNKLMNILNLKTNSLLQFGCQYIAIYVL